METFSVSFSFTLLAISVIAIGLIKLISSVYKKHNYWKKRGVPYIPSMPVFGTSWEILFRRVSVPEFATNMYNAYPNARYVCFNDMTTPGVLLRDPELIKEVTVKSFDYFMDHRHVFDDATDNIFGRNVFSLKGERWREMRNTLSPSFTSSKMKFLFDLVSKCSNDFVDYLYKHPEFSSSFEAKDAFTRYTNDVIATSAFGISVNSMEDRDNEFFLKGTRAVRFGGFIQSIKFVIFRVFPRLGEALGLSFFSKDIMNFFRKVVSETVKLRDEKGIIRPDMIHLLMQARNGDKIISHELTLDDIVAQAFIFFLAGFDTTSTLMCYLMHELAINTDVQDKLQKEVDEYLAKEDGEICYESLANMEYMEMVISETLRKYPPVVVPDRCCVKKFELPPAEPGRKSVTIDVGTTIMLPAYPMQHDPKYYPNPEKFDPERFNPENKNKIDPYTYLPFGIGPRKCIGNRFALMETKILLVHLLQKFNLKTTEKTQIPIVFSKKSFTLSVDNGFWLGLEKREK